MKKKIAAMLVIMSLACIQLAGCGQEEKKTEDNKISSLAMLLFVERVMGIEPTLSAWEADALPLSYTRITLKR